MRTADAQADLSLRWAHMPFCWFCHEAAHFSKYTLLLISFPRLMALTKHSSASSDVV